MRTVLGVLAGVVCLALFAAGCGSDEDEASPATAKRSATGAAPEDAGADAATEAVEPPGQEESEGDPGTDGVPRPGGEAGARAAAPARATLRTFLEGMGDGDPGTVCSTVTREVRALVGRTLSADCATGMDFAFRTFGVQPRAFRGVRVTRVRVTGDRAVAKLFLPARLRALPMLQIIAPRRQLSLEREQGRWRLGLALL